MRILAIETSCDDTAIAVLQVQDSKFKVSANVVSSQIKVHRKYGGVFPMMAKREHQKNLVPVLAQALEQAKLISNSKFLISNKIPNSKFQIINSILEREPKLLEQLLSFLRKYKKPNIDLIAVTQGPGLEPCLWVGVNFAKTLSYIWDIPIVPVNHIEAHILVNFLKNKIYYKSDGRRVCSISFPAMALVVSGGHTQLILVKGIGKYKIIGETRDDAAGECFDKCAKILGLEYPGGPEIAALAAISQKNAEQTRKSAENQYKLPRPMINTNDYDFSFSGLKTAVLYLHKELKNKHFHTLEYESIVGGLCYEIQQAIIDVLIKKTIAAAKNYMVKTIILGGGVSANQELRKQLKTKLYSTFQSFEKLSIGKKPKNNINILFPEKNLSTDNALMIAVTGYFHRGRKVDWKKLKAEANLRIS